VLRPLAHEAQRREVPERRRAAVAERHLVAVGQREQLGEPGSDASDDRAHGGLAVRRPQQRAADARERVDLLGADLARPRAESTVDGQQRGGNGDPRAEDTTPTN
jgi:hypothetical protein